MVDINQKTFRDIDWLLLFAPIALTVLGCLGIKSTAPSTELQKQIIALGIGAALALIVMFIDYRKTIIDIAALFYAPIVVMIVLVLCVGKEINGNNAWL